MPAIIGGAPSSGSSVLTNILNRHSSIYCGDETHLLTKSSLYKDWASNKHKLLSNSLLGLRSPGIHRFNGTLIPKSEGLEKLVKSSTSFEQFVNDYFRRFGKPYWIDKTPANGYCFDLFLSEFKEAKLIRIVRDPYDNIASLVSRGISVFKSCALYLCNNAVNLNLNKMDRYYTIRYEDLVNSPQDEMTKLLVFLELEYEEPMLLPDEGVVQMDGWLQNEKAVVTKKSINRFRNLSEKKQEEIRSMCSHMVLRNNSKEKNNSRASSIEMLCQILGYSYVHHERKPSYNCTSEILDRLESAIKLYPSNIFNYPAKIV